MTTDLILDTELNQKIAEIGRPVSTEEVDTYARLREIEDRSYKLRTAVDAWERQQSADRETRKTYAKWVLIGLFVQAALVNFAFFLIGFGWLVVEKWIATSFILAVFAELAGMTFLVLKYLFPRTGTEILALVGNT